MDLRKIVLLHSNDIHGDFFSEEDQGKLKGGMSLLSGYINKVRREEDVPVLYLIAGDMLQGSIIDQEYRGISTILIMNMLEPDVATLGNHELDYGLGHLMFLERCASFPIVNANLHIKPTGTQLFKPYHIIEVEGIRILFIGIITEEVLAYENKEPLIGTFISVEDAAREVERICNSYKDVDIDLTVLLTHIGIESDRKLAKILNKDVGVDLIIGGHSHTFMEQPEKVEAILIAQVGVGSDNIGRFDLTINMDTNSIHDFKWQTLPITNENCPNDPVMDELLNTYQTEVDGKYNSVICRLPRAMEHGERFRETEVGDLFADAFCYQLGVDIAFVSSGSIRKPELDPLVTLFSMMEIFPFDDPMISFSVSGADLIQMIDHLMKKLTFENTREFYQWNKELRVVIGEDANVEKILFKGEDINPDHKYRVAIQKYHYGIIEEHFGVSHEYLEKNGRVRVVTTSAQDTLFEYMRTNKVERAEVDGRITMKVPLATR